MKLGVARNNDAFAKMMIAIATLQSKSAEEVARQAAVSTVVDSFEGTCAIVEQNSKVYRFSDCLITSSWDYCL